MKKTLAILLAVLMLCSLCACAKNQPVNNPTDSANATNAANEAATENSTKSASGTEETTLPPNAPIGQVTAMKEYLDNVEYTAYYNIFYNQTADAYVGKKMTKEGTFTYIYDAWNEMTRYYVWGYADNTKCCDFQWEVVMPEGMEIPARGSYVKMKGTFTKDDNALDGYWFTDISLTVEEAYNGPKCDFDTTTMSGTLARVQIQNMEYKPDVFTGKTMMVYGRALNTNSIQHPYYDNAWSLDFTTDDNYAPATGQYMILSGTFTAGESGTGCYLQVDSHQEVA